GQQFINVRIDNLNFYLARVILIQIQSLSNALTFFFGLRALKEIFDLQILRQAFEQNGRLLGQRNQFFLGEIPCFIVLVGKIVHTNKKRKNKYDHRSHVHSVLSGAHGKKIPIKTPVEPYRQQSEKTGRAQQDRVEIDPGTGHKLYGKSNNQSQEGAE